MKKYLYLFLVSALTLTIILGSLSVVTYAHPGKTDSNGGHHNNSTGEYHYHHGYPAHDHYDMNGDGIKDCPYDFDDKTNHKGNSTAKDNTSKNNSSKNQTSITFIDVLKIVLYMIPITLSAMFLSYVICVISAIIVLAFSEYVLNKNIDDEKLKKVLLYVGICLTIVFDIVSVIYLVSII